MRWPRTLPNQWRTGRRGVQSVAFPCVSGPTALYSNLRKNSLYIGLHDGTAEQHLQWTLSSVMILSFVSLRACDVMLLVCGILPVACVLIALYVSRYIGFTWQSKRNNSSAPCVALHCKEELHWSFEVAVRLRRRCWVSWEGGEGQGRPKGRGARGKGGGRGGDGNTVSHADQRISIFHIQYFLVSLLNFPPRWSDFVNTPTSSIQRIRFVFDQIFAYFPTQDQEFRQSWFR